MNVPKLDGRTVGDILALFREKSKFYTPEWSFDESNPDGGAALAILFAEMFCGTIDRLDRYPDKCSLEFLNLLGASSKPVSPAVGVAAAVLAEGARERVYIKKGTALFTDKEDGRIVFETALGYYASPAKIMDIYLTDPARDIITHTSLSESMRIKPFFPQQKDNIQKHTFSICENSALKLDGAAEITLKFGGVYGMQDADCAALLSDSSARWTMPADNGEMELSARADNGCVILSKPRGAAAPVFESENDESGKYILTCDMHHTGNFAPIIAGEILISSRSVDEGESMRGRFPEKLFFNDTELADGEDFYAFGREPNAYDALYIKSDEVFSKAGATVTAEFFVATVAAQDGEGQTEPDFEKKLLVDKSDLKIKQPDDIYVSEIIWEYWNLLGWARLNVSGDVDLFSCAGRDKRYRISFICPQDMAASVHASSYGLWIRARVREVKNRYTNSGRWLLPLVKAVDLRFDYGADMVSAKEVTALNSCRKARYNPNGAKSRMELFAPMPDISRSVYLRFDKPPVGLPVNLYLGFEGENDEERNCTFSYSTDRQLSGWGELKVNDRTHGLCGSGIISMYSSDDFSQRELFGKSGYWVRISAPASFQSGFAPALVRAELNAVDIVQQISVTDEQTSLRAGSKNQTIKLLNSPVIRCEVWVNELGETPLGELEEIERADRERSRRVCGSDGITTEWWIKWECTDNLAACGADSRCCEIDGAAGTITFGDGVNGRIPSYYSNAQISVDYSYGGGSAGNLPANGLDGLISGVPFVEEMTNILPTCGGSDAQSVERVRKIGAGRLRHGGRAVTAQDYESLIAQEFSEVGEVKCFSGRNRCGELQNGCVSVVIKPASDGTDAYELALCRRVDAFLKERSCCEPIFGGRMAVIPARKLIISADVTVVVKDLEYAAQTENEIISSIGRLIERFAEGIGNLPQENDIYAALKEVRGIAYTTKVLLTGEYTEKGEPREISLDRMPDYPYFIAVNGTHKVRLDA